MPAKYTRRICEENIAAVIAILGDAVGHIRAYQASSLVGKGQSHVTADLANPRVAEIALFLGLGLGLDTTAMGYNDKPTGPGNYVYCYPQHVMSIDDDGTMHCGRMDLYFPQSDGRILGVTTVSVFPTATCTRPCFRAQWNTGMRVRSTTDVTIVRPDGLIGYVVTWTLRGIAHVEITPEFAQSLSFSIDGDWHNMLTTLPDCSPEVAGSHNWFRRPPATAGAPFRAWAYGHVAIPYAVCERLVATEAKQSVTGDDCSFDEFESIQARVHARLQQPSCDYPHCPTPDTPKVVPDFLVCPCCQVTLYCSPLCQELDRHRHAGHDMTSPSFNVCTS